jgi:hypothetical protein
VPKIENDIKSKINEANHKVREDFSKQMKDDFREKEKRILSLEGMVEDLRTAQE